MSGRLVLEWGVRDTLLQYLERSADFEAQVRDGAVYRAGRGIELPLARHADGTLRATGSVVLRAHGGALTVPLVGVVLDGAALWIDDPVDGPGARMPLVTLAEPVREEAPERGGGVVRYRTALAAQADVLFMYNYVPGAPFAPLFVREEG
ncbi:HtaA domain-containing protein [Microbacterium sp. 18062]|uniref:HtaA domain-containing protein n=1 Tax=Microbacterium sp. 18062 TaxID=2681410 RepID=UPI00135C0A87|nr:HtaA domain-containing protein [Microbacterium sp. 18062]